MFTGSYFAKSYYVGVYFPPIDGGIEVGISEGKLFLAVGFTYLEIELEKVALLPSLSGFFDENKEHQIYVSNGSTYTRLNIDV